MRFIENNNQKNGNAFLDLKKGFKLFFQYILVLVFIVFSTSFTSVYAAETVITNTATVSYSINSNTNQLSDSVQFTKDTAVSPPDEISLTKQANKTSAVVGELIEYSLTVNNPNNTALDNLIINDNFPVGLNYIVGTARLNGNLLLNSQITNNANQLSISLGSIPAQTSWEITYQARVTKAGTLINQATVVTDSVSDNAQASITVTEPVVIVIPPQSLQSLIISKTADKNIVSLGETINYSIIINNPNSSTVSAAVLHDNLPEGLVYIENSGLLNSHPISANTTDGLSFSLGNIPANAQWVISYQTTLENFTDATTLTNTANVTTTETDTDSNTANATVTVDTGNISISKTAAKGTVAIGNTLTYSITITNNESHNLSNLIVNDNLPHGFILQQNSVKIDGTTLSPSDITINNLTLQFSLNTLEEGKSATLTYDVLISSESTLGEATNTAEATSDLAKSATSSAMVNVIDPTYPLVLDKKSNVDRVRLGGLVEYNLTIKNSNSKPIKESILHDILPTGLVFIRNTATLNDAPITVNIENGLSFTLGDIPPNATWQLRYLTKLETYDNSNILKNSANIITATAAANSNTASVTVEYSNDHIAIKKVANKETVLIGSTVLYTIELTNPENHALSNILIHDTLPQGFVYQQGTAKIGNSILSDSDLQINNSALQFSINSIAKGETLSISYEVLVTENAQSGMAQNSARAESDFATSNTVFATVKVRTPSTITFFKIDNSGIESIIPPTSFNDSKDGGKNWQEIDQITLPNGVLIDLPTPQPILEAQEFSLSDPIIIEVQDLDQNLDPNKVETIIVTIEVSGTNDKEVLLLTETSPESGIFRGVILSTGDATQSQQNGRLTLAEGAQISVTYRDEEDLTDVSATAALVIPESKLVLTKTADKTTASLGELVRYTLTFKNTTQFQIPNVSIKDTLPLGFRLISDSIRLNGNALDSTQAMVFNGRALTFNLGSMSSGKQWTLEYLTKISAGTQIGDAINSAQIISEKFKSNIARATVRINDDLMRTHNILTGRVYIGCNTDSKNIRVLNDARIYLETGRSILSDKEGFWHMEGVEAGTHILQLDIDSLPSGYEPLLCNDNTRHAGDAQSQFVNLQAGTLWQVDFHVKENTSHNKNGLLSNDKEISESNPSKLFDKNYLEKADESFEIIWPKNNSVPSIASTKIFVKSSPKYLVEVLLNGKKVNPLNYDGSTTNKQKTIMIKRWLGVDIDIKRKNNTIVAILKDKSGKEVARKTHLIHFSGEADSVEFIREKSILIADGKTKPIIALRIKDEDGYPLRSNTSGEFNFVGKHYQVETLNKSNDKLDLNESTSSIYKYKVANDGLAYIELNPTTQSGEVKLKFKLKNREKVITAWLTPNLREWILVGLAEGTVAHKSLSGNMQALNDLDRGDRTYKQGRIAFFAKGKVKGKYLLTLAYDTHKKQRDNGSSLETPINTIDPDAWYTIYADNSHSQYDAPSAKKLYVKIEKDNFYAVFGDFQTSLSVTELTKYERTLTGIKSEYKGKRFEYKGFISETSNKHHHQEIPGDGTSGLYHLNNDILVNSEKVKIETRDRFHSETIIESRELTRYQDYEIDYDAGTLFFKFPINGRDQNFNPNFIVVDYDSETDAEKSIIAGGRIAVKTDDEKLQVGLSAIQNGRNSAKDDTLIGVDASYQITKDTKIRAEIAQSKSTLSEFDTRTAQILEIEKEISNLEAKIYYRKQEEGFGLGSEGSNSNIETGTKKIGADIRYKFNNKTSIKGAISKQDNLSNSNQRQLAEITLKHVYKQYDISTGLRHSEENLDNKKNNTDTFLLGGKYTTKNGKVSLRANIEKSFNMNSDAELGTDRAIVGVDVKLKKDITLFAEHETTNNGNVKTQNSRVGVNKSLWEGAKAKTTYSQERTDQGQRNYATLGLSQKISISEKIKADISIDHAKTLSGTQKKFNDNDPSVNGAVRDDYTAFTVGLGGNDKELSWTTRLELRKGDIEDKINFTAGIIRHLENGKQVSGKLSYYNSDNNGDTKKISKLSLGTAWHPKEKDFVFFSRLDLIDDNSKLVNSDTTNIHTQKIIHNMHYSRKLNKKTQVSLHHGLKHIIDRNNDSEHSATIDTGSLEVRHDISKKVDIGVRAGYLRDWTENTTESLAGVSLGITPAKNAWVELGYNFEGFDDKDFDENNYKHKGVYLSFRYKFNQDSFDGKDLPIHNKPKDKATLATEELNDSP